MAPTSIDGTEITGATIDGQDVSEITVDGETVFTAIPDIGVWQSEDSSAEFYEDNATVAANETQVSIDKDGEQALIDAILDRASYKDEQNVTDVDSNITISGPRGADVVFSWNVVSGRYKAEHKIEFGSTNSDMQTGIMVLGPWDISSADTLRYTIEASGSLTASVGIAVADEDGTSADVQDSVIDSTITGGSLDVSGLSGDKEVVVGSSGETNVDAFGRNVDIYFE